MILITRILYLVSVSSELSAHYSQLAGSDTPAGGTVSPALPSTLYPTLG